MGMVVLKVYYDRFGKNSARMLRRAKHEATLSNSLSFRSEVM